jgi:hypothetical protein
VWYQNTGEGERGGTGDGEIGGRLPFMPSRKGQVRICIAINNQTFVDLYDSEAGFALTKERLGPHLHPINDQGLVVIPSLELAVSFILFRWCLCCIP